MNRKKVAVGLSGGVDSAVSALLLKRRGFDVVGVHLYCWPPKSEVEKVGMTREEWIKKNGCRADEDRAAALKTALELGIPFKVLDFSEEYNQRVISYFYDEYEKGRTPNPDVLCNSEIKFGLFLDWALENGFDYVATGHYAKLKVETNLASSDHISLLATDNPASPAEAGHLDTRLKFSSSKKPSNFSLRSVAQRDGDLRSDLFHLLIPKDKHKDQTYFLWKLTQKELAHVLFPLGDLLKDEVREIAKEAGLSVAQRKDSQGICFVGNVDVKEFLARRLKDNPGLVVNKQGEVLGKHNGVWHYTIGERGGWEIDRAAHKRLVESGETPVLYVIGKKIEENVLVVGEVGEAVQGEFEVGEVNWIGGMGVREIASSSTPRNDIEGNNGECDDTVFVRIRHGGELIKAKIENIGIDSRLPTVSRDLALLCCVGQQSLRGNDKEMKVLKIVLAKKVRGIASGQSAVFYSSEGECLGGGVIK